MRVSAGGVAIEVDDQGPTDGEPLVLIMGLGMQLIAWPDELVQMLVARGFRVIRPDNRDIGLSQHFDHLGVPNLAWVMLRYLMHLPVHAPYRLADMAGDMVAMLDALGIASAHVCGASMGGMIAQHLAVAHPQRVKSLTLMMTTSGARALPQASAKLRRLLIARPASSEPEAIIEHLARLFRAIGSPAYPPDPQRLRERLRASVGRSWHPAGSARQLTAVAADGDLTPLLARITAPTRIVHGSDDPLVPVAAGEDLARRIRGASADIIPGMGHDLPLELLPRFADDIAQVARR
jgi:pimeloyl-ACP methyl ester carboxylesterase